jgi:metal-responsive CopG/Arc/MetJ family transcriptional regulator
MAKSKRGSDRFTVSIPDSLRDTMLKRCKKDKVTTSQLIRKALSYYLLGRDCEEQLSASAESGNLSIISVASVTVEDK